MSWTTKGMRQSWLPGEESFHPLPRGNCSASISQVPAPAHREASKPAAGGGKLPALTLALCLSTLS